MHGQVNKSKTLAFYSLLCPRSSAQTWVTHRAWDGQGSQGLVYKHKGNRGRSQISWPQGPGCLSLDKIHLVCQQTAVDSHLYFLHGKISKLKVAPNGRRSSKSNAGSALTHKKMDWDPTPLRPEPGFNPEKPDSPLMPRATPERQVQVCVLCRVRCAVSSSLTSTHSFESQIQNRVRQA